MKTFREFVTEGSSKPVSKGIYSEDGKKVNLVRSSKLTLNILYDDGTLEAVNWPKYKHTNLPDTSSDYIKGEFLKALAAKLKNFGEKVDYNSFAKKPNVTFEDKVEWFASRGIKYSKRGIKAV